MKRIKREDLDGLLESVKEAGEIRRGLRPAAHERVLQATHRAAPAPPFWGVCLETDDEELLIPRKLYLVQPVGPRVVVTDEAGEVTSCPAAWFLPVSLTVEAAHLVEKAA